MSPARVLITAEELGAGVSRLAAELSAAYDDGVVLVAVLKGSVPFLADLVRALTIVPEVDFLAIAAYAPDVHDCVEYLEVLGPPDIERRIGLSGARAIPVIAGGRVYVGSSDGRFYVLDAAKGEKIWEFDAGAPLSAWTQSLKPASS